MTRERILESLALLTYGAGRNGRLTMEDVADWHLAEVNRIVAPLVNLNGQWNGIGIPWPAINETLKRAGEDKT